MQTEARDISVKTTSTLIAELITTQQRIWAVHDQIADGDASQAEGLLKLNERRVRLMRALDARFGEQEISQPQKQYGTKRKPTPRE